MAENVKDYPDLFEPDVQMWVFEEETTLPHKSNHYDPSSEYSTQKQKLTKLINHFHENVKYLPGIALPHNLIANPSLKDSVRDSSILIFNLPHQFISGLCDQMKGHILPYARGVSCIKGVNVSKDEVNLFSETIGEKLGIYCGALSGANIANEVAQEKFSETTIAYDPPLMDSRNPTPRQSHTPKGATPQSFELDLTRISEQHHDSKGLSKVRLVPQPAELPTVDHHLLHSLFHRPYFHVRVVSDVAGVSLSGGLKNVVALAAGFVSGLGWGDNAKAAVMRVGLLEMVKFGQFFFSNSVRAATFTEESAGVADLITSCSGGRNYRCAKMSIERKVSIDQVAEEELNGQMLQGTSTAKEVYGFLKMRGKEDEFPLLVAVYRELLFYLFPSSPFQRKFWG